MTDDPSEPARENPFSHGESPAPDAPPWADADEAASGLPHDADRSGAFALDMARLWVQQHQKTAMLGAFALGTFVGALLRDS
jgi:hypothetical protein